MFTLKYALKSISRSIGRNILIAIIVFIIATAACVAMSIQRAAETAAETSLKGMSIVAQVNIDRKYALETAQAAIAEDSSKTLDEELDNINKTYAVSLDKMKEYAELTKEDSDEKIVKTYYYDVCLSINGEDIKKYDPAGNLSESETTAATEAVTSAPQTQIMTDPQGNVHVMEQNAPDATQPANAAPQEPQKKEKQGDFDLMGYNSYEAMKELEDFGSDEDAGCKITEGDYKEIFSEDITEYKCLIEENLADYNSLKVGDTITLVNPSTQKTGDDEDKSDNETYSMKIVGLYSSDSGQMSNGTDAANFIITSYAVAKDIETKSEETNGGTSSTAASSETATEAATEAASGSTSSDSDSSDGSSDALIGQFTGSYVLADVEHYELFEKAVENKSVADGNDKSLYKVTSPDLAAFKAGLGPLDNLKAFATTFLYLMLAIGAIVLIVISVISIRDRKYEIGVLAAMGMKKLKLSLMFMTEMLIITLIAIIIGAAVGSAVSVPITNSLLSNEVTKQEEENSTQGTQQQPAAAPVSKDTPSYGDVVGNVEYLDEVSFSVDIFVILKMLGIGIALAIVSGFTSILFILRYDPKQILANRD